MMYLHLPGGFDLLYEDFSDTHKLYHSRAGIFYNIQDPRDFRTSDDWIEYIERTANAQPGSFAAIIKQHLGGLYGQHWQAASSHHRGPANVASPGPGGATQGSIAHSSPPLDDATAYTATWAAIHARTITSGDAGAYYNYLRGRGPNPVHPSMNAGAALGAGIAQASQPHAQASMHMMTLAQYQQAVQPVNALGYLGPSGPPHERTSLKSEALIPGEIIAWRGWKVQGTELRSMTADSRWDPLMPMQGDAAGGWGIHAYKDAGGVLYDGYVGTQQGSWVLGQVALWGDVIEHEHGYRAQWARVHALTMWSKDIQGDVRKIIEAKYIVAHIPVQDGEA